MKSFKVISRKLTKTGKILFNLSHTITEGKEKGKEIPATCVYDKDQIATLLLLGSVPTIGTTVMGEFSLNSLTGEVSDSWVELSI